MESQCVFCYSLFESKQDRDRHHSNCIIRFSLLCMWYGESLHTTRAFKSSHNEQSIKDTEMAHAIRAVKKILDSISDVDATTSEPAIITGKAHVMGFCSSLILEATKEDFLQESSSPSTTTSSSSDESCTRVKSAKRRRKRKKKKVQGNRKGKQKKRRKDKEKRKNEETHY